jgi:hypothetical protein
VSSAEEDRQQGRHAYYAPEHGKVIDNVDPEGLHRIRASVAGIVEKTAWAYPIGTDGGGSAQRGRNRVPEIGADVIIQFLGGDLERPVYQAAWWGTLADGTDERPTEVAAVPNAEAHQIASIYEGRRLKVWVDERDGKQQLGIQDKGPPGVSEAAQAMLPFIQIDIETGTITLFSSAGTNIRSIGRISIEAAEVYIMGRLVLPDSKPI